MPITSPRSAHGSTTGLRELGEPFGYTAAEVFKLITDL